MVETSSSERRGDPNVAVLLTWFLPGAGHLFLGRAGFALLAFLVVEGLYVAGWFLSRGRIFEFLDPELQGPFATLLAPEAGNLGAMLLHLKTSGFGLEESSPFPPGIVLGSFLCATSGILNLFVAAHAHLSARKPKTVRSGAHPVAVLASGWLLPGLGHWLQGRRLRAVIVFCLLMGLFALGTWLAGGTNLSRERHFYYWSGQFLLGGPALLIEGLSGHPPVTEDMPWVDVGLLYACMAGLLNVLALLDVYGLAEKRGFSPASRDSTSEPQVGAPGPSGVLEGAAPGAGRTRGAEEVST